MYEKRKTTRKQGEKIKAILDWINFRYIFYMIMEKEEGFGCNFNTFLSLLLLASASAFRNFLYIYEKNVNVE